MAAEDCYAEARTLVALRSCPVLSRNPLRVAASEALATFLLLGASAAASSLFGSGTGKQVPLSGHSAVAARRLLSPWSRALPNSLPAHSSLACAGGRSSGEDSQPVEVPMPPLSPNRVLAGRPGLPLLWWSPSPSCASSPRSSWGRQQVCVDSAWPASFSEGLTL